MNALRKMLVQLAASSIVPVLILALWEWLSRRGVVKTVILPSPSKILLAYSDLVRSGELIGSLWASLVRVGQGYLAGAAIGMVVGILVGMFSKVNMALSFILGFLRPIPIIAWMPVLILWMGIDEGSKIAVIAIGSFWPVLTNVVSGIRCVDEGLLEVAKLFKKNRLQILVKIVLPSALPSIFTGLRIGVGIAWMCVVGAELIASASGIGYLIMSSREMLQSDVMFAGVFSIGVVGLLIDAGLRLIEKKLLRWNSSLSA